MANIIDSYSEVNQNSVQTFDASRTGESQSFTGDGSVIGSAKFYLAISTGSPTGNATANVYAHSGVFGTSSVPTGGPLAISDTFDVTGLTSSLQLITFTFSGINQITLSNGTNYVVTFEWGNGNGSNRIDVGVDTSSPTHAGNTATLFTGSWLALATFDTIFYVYDNSGSGTTSTSSTSSSTSTSSTSISISTSSTSSSTSRSTSTSSTSKSTSTSSTSTSRSTSTSSTSSSISTSTSTSLSTSTTTILHDVNVRLMVRILPDAPNVMYDNHRLRR